MPPKKLKEVNPLVSGKEEFKTLDQVLHPVFYDTKQSMVTILLQMPTKSTGKHQYHEGTNNTERRMIDSARQSLALIQETTSNPVELYYNTVKAQDGQHYFVIALSTKTSLAKMKEVVKIYIHNVLQRRQFSDQIQVLIATGQKVTWQENRSHIHETIIAPAVVAMMNKNKASKQPEEYHKGSKEEAGHKGMEYGGSMGMGPISRAILTAYQSMAGSGHVFGRLQTQNSKDNEKQAQKTMDEFKRKFQTGALKSKDKKIGEAMQFLISSAGFTIDQLQGLKRSLENSYKVKVVKAKVVQKD